jgi:prepilin-type N-terminal cleavage/methylation domain-containing protein
MMNRLRNRMAHEQDGFTLIELLIVIVILGVLAGIVVFAVGGINDTSKVSACKADVKSVEVASEAYYANASPHAYATAVGGTGATTLVGAKFLREAPSTANYTVTYDPTTGAVGATGLAGCP